jgi:type IV secretory pathway VirB10-like protein
MLNMLNGRICKTLYKVSSKAVRTTGASWLALFLTALFALAVLLAALPTLAQDQSQPGGQTPAQAPAQAQPPDNGNGKPKQDVPAEAGGPGDNLGPYAIPKKTETEPPPPPPPPTPKKLADVPDYSLTVNVPLVNVDVSVTTKDGQFVPGLRKEHFRIIEDGVQQTITN